MNNSYLQPIDQPGLRATGIFKRHGSVEALRDASISVAGGEVVALIGPNGSGKTTLLDAIAGLLDVDRGSVTVDGQPVPREERARHLFYLPDGVRPWPDQAVDWALRMMEGLFGGTPTVRMMAIERLGLIHLLPARIGTLSKGEHKRILLAAAINTPQPILLLDEPFDGLDLRQTREVMTLLREHVATGRGLILSIHQLTDAARVADRLVLLNSGVVAGSGTLDELRGAAKTPGATLEEVFLALT
jgi:ABC-type multidrug transport system ATPase subunit